jgi:hypothetical protein
MFTMISTIIGKGYYIILLLKSALKNVKAKKTNYSLFRKK